MKKITLCALALALAFNASAEGYQVNTLSAKQLGMGHTSVSMKLNSESVWFNPGATAMQDQKFTFSAGVTGISPVATWSDGTTKCESDNDISTPLYLNMNYKINDDLAVGLMLNTPYGSSMNWGDNWAGMDQVQSISLQSYNIQPTVSYKLLDGKLSIGAGLMVSWGSFELSKSIPTQIEAAGLENAFGSGEATATLSGDAAVAFGYNIGVLYDINSKWSIGASYRSKMAMVVDDGATNLAFGNEYLRPYMESKSTQTAALLSIMESNQFSAELPMPWTLSAGATFYPTEKWTLSAELQMVGWGTYQNLDFYYSEQYTNSSVKDYKNTMIYRIGAEYKALDWLTTRAGFYFDESPVKDEYFSPETPSMNKLGYTAGVSFMPCKQNRYFSIDLAYAYIAPAGYDRVSTLEAFGGTYRAVANCASIGVTWGF